MKRLWIVEIDEEDWEYDRFEKAAVWAETGQQALNVVRAALRYPDNQEDPVLCGDLWIEDRNWKLNVRPAPDEGLVLFHWHAG